MPRFKRAKPSDHISASQRKKIKIDKDHQSYQIPNNWVSYSDTGRLDLYSDQYRICQSAVAWYDDLIINSYARMCQVYRTNSFVYQDTCLANPHRIGGFQSVDQKFIQIMNPSNSHWFCVSNALTYRNEPHIVEVFDSLKTVGLLRNEKVLNRSISNFILQLKPQTTVIRYVKTQEQRNGYDCGPLALSFLWSLSMGHHPLRYEYISGPMIRKKVRQSFVENRFIPPCTTSPKFHAKIVMKSFKLDLSSNQFLAN